MLHLSVSPISHFCHQTWLLYVLPADVFACPSLKGAWTVRTIKCGLDFSVAEEGQEATGTSHSLRNYSWMSGRKFSQARWPNTGRSCSETLWHLIFGSGTRWHPEVLLGLLFCGSLILSKSLSILHDPYCLCNALDRFPSIFVPLSEIKLPQHSPYCDQFSTNLQTATPHPMHNELWFCLYLPVFENGF